jgi:hypothetical protein
MEWSGARGGGIVVAIDVDETTSEQRGDEEMRGGVSAPFGYRARHPPLGCTGDAQAQHAGGREGEGRGSDEREGGRQWSRAWSLCGFYKASGTLLGFAFWWGPARGSIGGWLLGF